ncbi:MAG: DUF2818 family protein [Gammaproteobacteria bacterium]
MIPKYLAVAFLVIAFLAANLPWLSERFLGVIILPRKNGRLRWLEWLLLYVLTGLLAFALEYKVTGTGHAQDWEFYVTTFCLFMVFGLPGFIYHYDLKKMLHKNG